MLQYGNGLRSTFGNTYENDKSNNKKMDKLCYKKENLCHKVDTTLMFLVLVI